MNSRPFGVYTPLYFVKDFRHAEVSHRAMMAIGWSLDALYNFLLLVILCATTALFTIFVVFVVVIPALLMYLLVWLFSLLL